MLSCREASNLCSEALDRRLAVRERLSLRFHLAICAFCRRYAAQIDVLRRAAERLGVAHGGAPDALTPEARERLRNALRRP